MANLGLFLMELGEYEEATAVMVRDILCVSIHLPPCRSCQSSALNPHLSLLDPCIPERDCVPLSSCYCSVFWLPTSVSPRHASSLSHTAMLFHLWPLPGLDLHRHSS